MVRAVSDKVESFENDPFSAFQGSQGSSPTSGILFDNMVDKSRIQIYTVTGALVFESGNELPGGSFQWSTRNGDGKDVASGVYFALISGPGNSPIVRKIVVIR